MSKVCRLEAVASTAKYPYLRNEPISILNNPPLQLAEDFVLYTGKNIFLTGRAGTGKTTFLQNVLKKTAKNCIVAAPTGVAAINAGGSTLHSLFQFPLTAFTPDIKYVDFNIATNRRGLAKHIRYRRDKVKMLRQLDLLVIDEISMVRVDLLDAVDFALRKARQVDQPFGGVQILAIGDLFQLAPVVRPPIWNVLEEYYESPFFFDARAWKQSDAITIQLTKVYRQKNQEFIEILNRIRHGTTTDNDVERLNQRFDPNFSVDGTQYITLTTHNYKADRINQERMDKLDTKARTYDAKIEGSFSESAYPADPKLILKEGAQVMFLRNDPQGRYYNGKIAQVVSTKSDAVKVKIDGDTMEVEQTTWDNIQYELNKETNKIEEKNLGSFSQYPLRLAWAITVHKSQGLTFDHMIVDLDRTFATGQAYVALSRCTSLDGLVLLSRIRRHNVKVNHQIVSYHDQSPQDRELEQILEKAKLRHAAELLKKTFELHEIEAAIEDWEEDLAEREIPDKSKAMALLSQSKSNIRDLGKTSRNFIRQLAVHLDLYAQNQDAGKVSERAVKAVEYFTEELYKDYIEPVHEHIKALAYKTRVKKYLAVLLELQRVLWKKMDELYDVSFLGESLYTHTRKYKREDHQVKKTASTVRVRKKGATYQDTLDLFNEGKSIEEIATIRSLAVGTIESHITRWIRSGDISISDVLSKEEVDVVSHFLREGENESLTQIKNQIPIDISYNKIRMVMAYLGIRK